MKEQDRSARNRREFLRLVGSGAAALPLITIAACSGGEQSAPASSPAPAPAEEPAAETEPAGTSSGEAPASDDMPRLSEDDPQAKSLGYVHDVADVDQSKYPRYQEGQACSNCALWQGGDAEWGGCSIFPGRQVKATGWCNVYAPKAG